MPQQLSIEGALTGRENVMWFARLFDVPRAERAERVDAALESMALSDAADRLANTYSGGMVRRLELAQALVNRPALLILDEPTIGLDPVARDSVWERVEELRNATGMTVLLTTHYMEEADALCDRIALMHLGTIRTEGTPEELKDELGGDATLEDVFRHFTGDSLADEMRGRPPCRSELLAPPRAGWADAPAVPLWRRYPSRVGTFCLVELQKLRHDRSELLTRAVQPILWLRHLRRDVQPHPRDPDRAACRTSTSWRPAIIAQSGLFVAIFYGIQIIWERDAGVLDEAPRHAHPALGADPRQGVRRRHPRDRAGDRRADRLRDPRRRADVQPAEDPRRDRRGRARRRVLLVPLDDDRRHRAEARPADGHRPDDHDAAVLRLERALPGGDHARLGARAQPRQPAHLRGQTRCAGC